MKRAKAQMWGEIEVPTNPAAAQAALTQWQKLEVENTELFEAEARARTVDPKLAARIVSELWKKARS